MIDDEYQMGVDRLSYEVMPPARRLRGSARLCLLPLPRLCLCGACDLLFEATLQCRVVEQIAELTQSAVVMSTSAVCRTAPAAMTACAPKTYQRIPSGESARAIARSSAAMLAAGTRELLLVGEQAAHIAARLVVANALAILPGRRRVVRVDFARARRYRGRLETRRP
jgi:hypothetical protein